MDVRGVKVIFFGILLAVERLFRPNSVECGKPVRLAIPRCRIGEIHVR